MTDHEFCGNCERAISAPDQSFCPGCGQSTPTHRIDWHFLWHELQHSVLHVDRGIFFTLRELALRPGHLIRDYLSGKRIRHFRPLLLLVILAAIWTFAAKYILHTDVMAGGMQVQISQAEASAGGAAAGVFDGFKAFQGWMDRNFAFAMMLMMPLYALSLKWAFRRFCHLNYPEWLVIAAWLTVQSTLIMLAGLPALLIWKLDAMPALTVALIAANAFALVQFFKGYPAWKSVLRGVLAYVTLSLMSGLAGLIVAFLAMVIGRS